MPVIFLDIDGVLNRSSEHERKQRVVDETLLVRFKQLVQDTDSEVVLASTWRHDPGGMAAARELGIPFDDVLPDLRPQSRGDEVRAWLASHDTAGRFVVLDDDNDGYESLPLFQPNPREGLSPRVAAAVKAYLNGERDIDLRRSLPIRLLHFVRTFVFGHRG
jgi:hypothetical protein